MSPSSFILMKRIFLTLGLLLFAGGSYYIGQNYTLVQLSPEQIAQMNTTGIQSSVLGSDGESSE